MKARTIFVLVFGLFIIGLLLTPVYAAAQPYWYGGTAAEDEYSAAADEQYSTASGPSASANTANPAASGSGNAALNAYSGGSMPNTGVPLLIPVAGMAAVGLGGLIFKMRNLR